MFFQAHTFNLDTQEWSLTDFETRKIALDFVRDHTKYPGEYNLKYTKGVWNEPAEIFHANERKLGRGKGHYPIYAKNSADFRKYWDFEKAKCQFDGFLIYKKPSENLEYVVPCLFYWYLNYCPIPDKVKGRRDFPDIYDGDLHYFLYILEAILVRQYGAVLKKRQSGYTLKNMAIMLNAIWFGEEAMAKIFARDESKVKESWSFMTTYRDHINTYCGWTRGFDPKKPLNWHIRRKQTDGSYKGNNSQAKGFTTQQDPTNGIGGSAAVIFGEESGANDTLDVTHEFITSNVAYGGLVTGLIIYSGAVGELDKAEPLKEFILHPLKHNFVARPNNIEDDAEFGEVVAFFAPEWWNYVSVERDENDTPVGEALYCFDEWGNSNKELALSEIMKWRELAKKKDPEKYRYYCSQRPLSIKEAFAFRKDMVFPANLVANQERRILDSEYPVEYVDIIENSKGELEIVKSDKTPIREFPLKETSADKEGVICMWERPHCYPKRPDLGQFNFATIDPLSEGKTITSESLFAIYIIKFDVQVIRQGEEAENFIEPGKIVAAWCGRFDDINKTNSRAERMLEIYGAQAVVENNVSTFITHMINRKKSHYLIPKKELLFLKELGANASVFSDFGWRNTGTLFKSNLLSYGVDFTKEIIDSHTEGPDKPVINIHGIQRIPDIMLLKEMRAYYHGLNVDRLVAFCAGAAYLKLRIANFGYAKRIEQSTVKKPDPSLYAKPTSFFRQGAPAKDPRYNVKKGGFRNLR